MKRVLVIGAGGQLGQCLQKAVGHRQPPKCEFIFLERKDFDICYPDLISSYFFSNSVDVLVNCAAYTAVDRAQEEVESAFRVNADAVGIMAKECAEQKCTFIHLSTDYVFGEQYPMPISELEKPKPLNVYGKSKLEGERLAMLNNPNSVIIRTAWVYSEFGNNFLKTMLRLFQERDSLEIVNDQIGSPTNANDLANMILDILSQPFIQAGIYHYTNQGTTSWYGFAEKIKQLVGSKIELSPISSDQYPTPAIRPRYSVLDCEKIKTTFGIQIPDWEESLKELIKTISI